MSAVNFIQCTSTCEPNPGPVGEWAFRVFGIDGHVIDELEGKIVGTPVTNNVAEYTAVLEALRWMYRGNHTGCQVFTHSQLVVKQILGASQVEAEGLIELHARVVKGLAAADGKIVWVRKEDPAPDDRVKVVEDFIKAEMTSGKETDDEGLEGWECHVLLPGCKCPFRTVPGEGEKIGRGGCVEAIKEGPTENGIETVVCPRGHQYAKSEKRIPVYRWEEK